MDKTKIVQFPNNTPPSSPTDEFPIRYESKWSLYNTIIKFISKGSHYDKQVIKDFYDYYPRYFNSFPTKRFNNESYEDLKRIGLGFVAHALVKKEYKYMADTLILPLNIEYDYLYSVVADYHQEYQHSDDKKLEKELFSYILKNRGKSEYIECLDDIYNTRRDIDIFDYLGKENVFEYYKKSIDILKEYSLYLVINYTTWFCNHAGPNVLKNLKDIKFLTTFKTFLVETFDEGVNKIIKPDLAKIYSKSDSILEENTKIITKLFKYYTFFGLELYRIFSYTSAYNEPDDFKKVERFEDNNEEYNPSNKEDNEVLDILLKDYNKETLNQDRVESKYKLYSGIKKGNVIMLYGGGGSGKSTFALNIAVNQANILRLHGQPSGEQVIYITSEMSIEELFKRATKIAYPKLDIYSQTMQGKENRIMLQDSTKNYLIDKMAFYDVREHKFTGGQNLDNYINKILKGHTNVSCVIVDYFQLAVSEGSGVYKTELYRDIIGNCQKIAEKYNTNIILISGVKKSQPVKKAEELKGDEMSYITTHSGDVHIGLARENIEFDAQNVTVIKGLDDNYKYITDKFWFNPKTHGIVGFKVTKNRHGDIDVLRYFLYKKGFFRLTPIFKPAYPLPPSKKVDTRNHW